MMTTATATGGVCRITHQLIREPLRLGFCSKLSVAVESAVEGRPRNPRRQWRTSPSSGVAVRCIGSNCCHGELSVLPDSFSQKGDGLGVSSDASTSVTGGVVALGKFDALHIGHRELAVQASKIGTPFLLSFVGMAEVLGWQPRAPIVAKCDRKRVLTSWGPHCGNVAPREVLVEFSSVRHLTPRQFVEKLSKELGVLGVVAGENYRFGYKAAGDASELVILCNEFGIGAYIIDSVMDKHQDSSSPSGNNGKERGQVSSTRVRHALAMGDMSYVSELLGRRHRLMLSVGPNDETKRNEKRISIPKSQFLNLAPKDGVYEDCFLIWMDENQIPCAVNIDATDIHLELDHHSVDVISQDFPVLGIEFGDS
ncbi:FAD synthetase 2, chloroplastic-like protein [Drosera capensis]